MALNNYIPTLKQLASNYIQQIDNLELQILDLKYSEKEEEKLKE